MDRTDAAADAQESHTDGRKPPPRDPTAPTNKPSQLTRQPPAPVRRLLVRLHRILTIVAQFFSRLSVDAYRWVGGCYFLLLGLTTLILPQGSLSPKLELVGLRGAIYLVAGLSVLWLNILPLSKRALLWLVCVVAIGLFGIVAAYLSAGAYALAATIFLFTCGLFLLPFASPRQRKDVTRHDALGLILGAALAAQGLDFLFHPAASAAIPKSVPAAPVGVVFFVCGASIVITQLATRLPSAAFKTAHVAGGLLLLALWASQSSLLDPLYWVLGAGVILRGVTTIVLPWWGPYAARLDRRAYRFVITLAVMTASIVPIAIVVPVLIYTNPALAQNIAARQQVYGIVVLSLTCAGIAGWWLSRALTWPLASVTRRMRAIAAGNPDMPPVELEGTEWRQLSHTLDRMNQALQQRYDELRESEARYRALVETANEGVWLVDMLGRTVYTNERMAALLGYQAAELTGRPVTDFVFPEDVELVHSLIGGNLQGNSAQFDFRFRRRDGRALLVLAGTSPLRDATGEIAGALGMFSDITERQRMEARAAHLAAIVESAEDAIVSKTLEGIVTSWNTGAERMFGYTAQEMIGQSIRRLIPPDRQSEEDEILASIGAGQRIEHYETVRITQDGQPLEVSLTISPIRDKTGAIIGASKIARDVTGRHRLERQFAEQAQRVQTIFETITDAVFLFDADGRIVDANPAGQRQLPTALADFSSRPRSEHMATFAPRDSTGAVLELAAWPTNRLLRGEVLTGEASVDILARFPDGRDRWLSVSGAPIRNDEGLITGAVGVTRDITERRNLEVEVRQARDKLELRVAGRTRELARANRELRRLSQRILEVQESERRLIARELHDEIGQALTGAKMMLELLERQSAHASWHGHTEARPAILSRLGDVRAAVGDALAHVRDLSLDLRPAILDSMGLLPALFWQFERYTRQTGIQIHFQQVGLEQRLPPEIEISVYRLIQEALTNVARHAHVAEVAVQARVSGEILTLYVVDGGRGFDVERALEAGASTGLAGMRERAALLGGIVRFSSAPGEGATVEAELPLHASSTDPLAVGHSSALEPIGDGPGDTTGQ